MIRHIIAYSARNRLLVLLGVGALCVLAVYLLREIRLDALPDLSDTQVIVYSRWDRSPDVIEDQVTYPIVTALLGAPKVKAIRGFSDFGYSFVYVIFQDGTLGRLRVAAGVANLFNRAYVEHLSYQRDPFRTGTKVFEPGRNVYVNLAVAIGKAR